MFNFSPKRKKAGSKRPNGAVSMESVLSSSSTAAMVTDMDGRITYANPAAREFFHQHRKTFRQRAPHLPSDRLKGLDVASLLSQEEASLPSSPSAVYQCSGIEAKVNLIRGPSGSDQGYLVEFTATSSDRGARLESALEGSQTPMMMVDRDLIITYANPATYRLMETNLQEFKGIFPSFNPKKLIGTCIDGFHEHPEHQRRILGDPSNLPHQADIRVGGLTFALNITAMEDSEGNYIGCNLEWDDVGEARRRADEAAGLLSMIEGASACFMTCNADRVITYCNRAVVEMLDRYCKTFRKLFPGFEARKLVGTSIDSFHKNPRHQAALLAEASSRPYKTELKIADLEFGLTLTTLRDDEGNYIGNAVEWADYNARATYGREVQELIGAYKEGRLSQRGDLEALDSAFRPMMAGIHDVVETISAPIRECIQVLENVAAGNLSRRVTGDYQGDFGRMKNAFNNALETLDQGMMQVSEASLQMASASKQISSGSQSLAQGASEQASTLEEVSANLQEVSSMTKQNAANAQEASGLSKDTCGTTEQGVESMRKLSSAIERIKSSAHETAKIVKTIDEIAFQTNLLALNAAVEAARAGAAGRGFAVVAEEVRNLAMRSAEAAKNTSALIQESVTNADDGVNMNEEVLKALEAIDQKVRKVTEVMNEIAAASEQQDEGIDQVNTAVEQINQVTQQTAANSQESAATSEQLTSQAQELLNLVRQFQLSQSRDKGGPSKPRLLGNGSQQAGRNSGYINGNDSQDSSDAEKLIPFDDADSESVLEEF